VAVVSPPARAIWVDDLAQFPLEHFQIAFIAGRPNLPAVVYAMVRGR
jgi:hypothetical protein